MRAGDLDTGQDQTIAAEFVSDCALTAFDNPPQLV
jgi:hypothetical protein